MDVPNLVFVLRFFRDGSGYRVFALHTGGDVILKHLFDWNPTDSLNSDFVTSGSKLYLVGGSGSNPQTKKWPRDFLMWDLTNWRNKDKDDFKFEVGPPTVGAKPCPCLFSLDEAIYALAGLGYFIPDDIPDPIFEVYKEGDTWKPLSPPPFEDYYKQRNRYSDMDHKLVGRTLYVSIGGFEVYTYDVDGDIWKTIRILEDDIDYAVKNMFSYWTLRRISREEIDDKMVVFSCSDTIEMLACDFTEHANMFVSEEIKEEEEQHDTEMSIESEFSPIQPDRSESDFDSVDNDDLYLNEAYSSDSPEPLVHFDCNLPEVRVLPPYVRVTGLEEITKQVDRNRYSTSGFVAHLAGNIYCVVYFYDNNEGDEGSKVLACKFEVTKQSGAAAAESGYELRAKVLSSDIFPIDCNLTFDMQWFKIRV